MSETSPDRSPGLTRTFTRRYLAAFGTAALIGLVLGVIWVIAGILHFHPLW